MKEGEREGGGRVFMLDCKDGRHGSHEKGDYVACLAVWTDGVGGWGQRGDKSMERNL